MAEKTKDLAVGVELPSMTRVFPHASIVAYSSWPAHRRKLPSQHTSDEIARSVGRPGIIAQGLQYSAPLQELLHLYFGDAWLTSGQLSVNYLKYVLAGDAVTAQAHVEEISDGPSGRRLHLRVACVNQRGETVAGGTASVII